MTRIFFDTEFNDDGRTIELISIGMVSEGALKYYAISKEFDPERCNDWVKKNVLPHLPAGQNHPWKTRKEIASSILSYVDQVCDLHNSPKIELWGYFSSYDWVVLCQLYGPQIDIPKRFPKFCLDLKQLAWSKGVVNSDLPEQLPGTQHNALHDAEWNLEVYKFLTKGYKGKKS